MNEITLESLAKRVEALERLLNVKPGVQPPVRDWQSVVGMFSGSEFMKQVNAEGRAIREKEREEARRENPE
jgi:hypothetical protein